MWNCNFFLGKEEGVSTNSPRDLATNNFLQMCEKGDIERVESYLDIRDNIFINTGCLRDVGLLFACCSGSEELVNLLLERGSCVNSFNKHGETPLHVACLYGKLEIISLLLQEGAHLLLSNSGKGCLHYACKSGKAVLVDHMLNDQSPLSSYITDAHRDSLLLADHENITPLHVACQTGSLAVVKTLVGHGASMYSQTSSGETALMIALQSKSHDVVMTLLESIPEELRTAWINLCYSKDDFETAMHIASKNLSFTSLERLLDLGGNVKLCMVDGSNPLHCACWGDLNIKSQGKKRKSNDEPTYDETFPARKLIMHLLTKKKYVENMEDVVNAFDHYGMCAAHYICRHGNRHDPILMKILLQAGFLVNTPTAPGAELIDVHHSFPFHAGTTCLHLACANGSLSLARLLLQKKADPNVKSAQGWTPLHCALHCHKFCHKTIRLVNLLLANGADVDLCDEKGKSTMHYATSPRCEESGYHNDIVHMLLNKSPDLNKRDHKGRTPLLNAIVHEMDTFIVQKILSRGADPNIKDINNDFPLKILLDQYASNRYFTVEEKLVFEFLQNGSLIPKVEFVFLNNSQIFKVIDWLITAGKKSLVATSVVPAIEKQGESNKSAEELFKTCQEADPLFLFNQKSVLEAATKQKLEVEFPSLYCLSRTSLRKHLAGCEGKSILPIYKDLPLPDIIKEDVIFRKSSLMKERLDDMNF